jgi:hypothetical protein
VPTMAGIAGVTIVKSRAERSTDRQSDIMVQAIVAVVRRGDSADEDGAGAGVSLSTVLPGGSVRELDVEETLASPRALDIVRTK